MRTLENITAGAMLVFVAIGFVCWLSFVVSGVVPELLVAVGVYSAVIAELGSRMLGRLRRL